MLAEPSLAPAASWQAPSAPIGPDAALLAEVVADIVATRPGDAALRHGDNTLTYAGLWSLAQQYAGGLHVAGARLHDRIGITLPDGPERLACELAVAILGATWLSPAGRSAGKTRLGNTRLTIARDDRWDELTPERLCELDDHVPRLPRPAGLGEHAPACIVGTADGGVTLTQAEIVLQLRAEANETAAPHGGTEGGDPHAGYDPGWRAIICGGEWAYPSTEEPAEPERPSLKQRLWSLIG